MRQIKVQAVSAHSLHNPNEKHELHIVGSNMTNVVCLTDNELASLRAQLAAYQPDAQNAHYGASENDVSLVLDGSPFRGHLVVKPGAHSADYGASPFCPIHGTNLCPDEGGGRGPMCPPLVHRSPAYDATGCTHDGPSCNRCRDFRDTR